MVDDITHHPGASTGGVDTVPAVQRRVLQQDAVHSEAAGRDALSDSSVERAHDGAGGSGSSQVVEEELRLRSVLDEVLLVQDRSLVTCTPRNLVLLTLTTAVLS